MRPNKLVLILICCNSVINLLKALGIALLACSIVLKHKSNQQILSNCSLNVLRFICSGNCVHFTIENITSESRTTCLYLLIYFKYKYKLYLIKKLENYLLIILFVTKKYSYWKIKKINIIELNIHTKPKQFQITTLLY